MRVARKICGYGISAAVFVHDEKEMFIRHDQWEE
jgi:hypothetical protein